MLKVIQSLPYHPFQYWILKNSIMKWVYGTMQATQLVNTHVPHFSGWCFIAIFKCSLSFRGIKYNGGTWNKKKDSPQKLVLLLNPYLR